MPALAPSRPLNGAAPMGLSALDSFPPLVARPAGAQSAAPESALAEMEAESAGIVRLDDCPPGAAPAVVAVQRILAAAVREEASDIHVESERDGLLVRYRIDGMMFERFSLRADLSQAVMARIKILSNMNVAEHRLPQDGRCTLQTDGKEYDVRVSVVPGVRGEKAVLRVLPKSAKRHSLEALGFEGRNLKLLTEMVQRPHGMLLVTGPTGSGKTTTLYAALCSINHAGKNMITIEDPVEYELSRVTQIQVHNKIGLTFASGLRSILRQDPDVVMVGEIRDAETLSIATQAALTGHLVLSTLHCNDAASAAARCVDLGTEPFLFTSATSAILAQRLVRKVCERCREVREVTDEVREALRMPGLQGRYAVGRGCEACRGTGYRGRTAVFELLQMTEQVKRAIHRKETSSVIRSLAIQDGMLSLREDAARKMLAGLTTPEEVLRAVCLDE